MDEDQRAPGIDVQRYVLPRTEQELERWEEAHLNPYWKKAVQGALPEAVCDLARALMEAYSQKAFLGYLVEGVVDKKLDAFLQMTTAHMAASLVDPEIIECMVLFTTWWSSVRRHRGRKVDLHLLRYRASLERRLTSPLFAACKSGIVHGEKAQLIRMLRKQSRRQSLECCGCIAVLIGIAILVVAGLVWLGLAIWK